MKIFNFFYNVYEKIVDFFYEDYISHFDIYTTENIKTINEYVNIDVKKYKIEELKFIFDKEIEYRDSSIEKITMLRKQITNINNILIDEDIKQDLLLEIMNDN